MSAFHLTPASQAYICASRIFQFHQPARHLRKTESKQVELYCSFIHDFIFQHFLYLLTRSSYMNCQVCVQGYNTVVKCLVSPAAVQHAHIVFVRVFSTDFCLTRPISYTWTSTKHIGMIVTLHG